MGDYDFAIHYLADNYGVSKIQVVVSTGLDASVAHRQAKSRLHGTFIA